MASRSIVRAQVQTRTNKPAVCPHHRENKAVLICLKQECNKEFACVECVATNHRGHEMEQLETYAAGKKIALKNEVKNMKTNVLGSLRRKLETTKNKISSNKSQTRDEQRKIYTQCNTLKEKLDKIANKYAKSCARMSEENDKKLREHLACLESIYTKYESEQEQFEKVLEEGYDSDIVLVEEELPVTPDTPPFPDISISKFFYINSPLEALFGELVSIADTTQKDSVMSRFNLQRYNYRLCGLIQQLSDKIYVWFRGSFNVYIFEKGGKHINTITLQSFDIINRIKCAITTRYIDDMCVSPVDETLWSVNTKGRIQQVKQDGTLLQSLRHSAGTDDKTPYLLCVTRRQEVVVGQLNCIYLTIYTTTGVVKWTLKLNDIGLDPYPTRFTQCQRTGRLVVADSYRVSVMDEKYNPLYTIHGDRVSSADDTSRPTGYTYKNTFHPGRMCFDSYGNLLLDDYGNYNVVMFSPSGQYIQTIIKETDDDKHIVTINTGPDGTLWIAHRDGVIRQISLSQI